MAFRGGRENKGCAEARDEPWTDVFVASIDGRRLSRFNGRFKGVNDRPGTKEGSVFTVRASSFNRCERGRSDVFTRLFPREIVVCSSFALRGDDEWGEGGVEGGIANGIEGFTAIMAISRVDTFLFFFCFFFLPILTPDRRIFEIYWRYGTKKRDVINDGRILLCCFEILNCV